MERAIVESANVNQTGQERRVDVQLVTQDALIQKMKRRFVKKSLVLVSFV